MEAHEKGTGWCVGVIGSTKRQNSQQRGAGLVMLLLLSLLSTPTVKLAERNETNQGSRRTKCK